MLWWWWWWWWCFGNMNYVSFVLGHILCWKPQSRSVPGDVVIPECMTPQHWLGALIVCLLFSEWMQTPLNLWGPLYNNRGKCIFHLILQSKVAWMPWNVHYFLSESYKAYSFTLQSNEFCYLNNKYFNNRCEFSTHKQSKSGVEFKGHMWAVHRRDFYCMNCFYPDPQGLLALFPMWSFLVFMQYCSHAGK